MKFPIFTRYTERVLFVADIEADEYAPTSIKTGLALIMAYRSGINLRNADVRGAKLRGARLHYANLFYADFRGADLFKAELFGCELRGCDFRGADMRESDLRETCLSSADTRGANLEDAIT